MCNANNFISFLVNLLQKTGEFFFSFFSRFRLFLTTESEQKKWNCLHCTSPTLQNNDLFIHFLTFLPGSGSGQGKNMRIRIRNPANFIYIYIHICRYGLCILLGTYIVTIYLFYSILIKLVLSIYISAIYLFTQLEEVHLRGRVQREEVSQREGQATLRHRSHGIYLSIYLNWY